MRKRSDGLRRGPGSPPQGDNNGESLEIWGVLAGSATIGEVPLASVRFALLPAAMGAFAVSASRDSVLLRTYVGRVGQDQGSKT